MHTRPFAEFKNAVDKFENPEDFNQLIIQCEMKIKELQNLHTELSHDKDHLKEIDPERYSTQEKYKDGVKVKKIQLLAIEKELDAYQQKLEYAKLGLRSKYPLLMAELIMAELTKTTPLKEIPNKVNDLFTNKDELQQFNYQFYYYLIENAHTIYQAQLKLVIGDEDKQKKFIAEQTTKFLNDYPKTYREYLVRQKGEAAGLNYDSSKNLLIGTAYSAVNPYIKEEENFEKHLKKELQQKAIDEAPAKAKAALNQLKENPSREICNQFIQNIKDLIESIDWTNKVSKIWGFGGKEINGVVYPYHVAQVYQHCVDWSHQKGDVFDHFNAIALIGIKAKPKPLLARFGLTTRDAETQKVYDAIEKMKQEMPKMVKSGPQK